MAAYRLFASDTLDTPPTVTHDCYLHVATMYGRQRSTPKQRATVMLLALAASATKPELISASQGPTTTAVRFRLTRASCPCSCCVQKPAPLIICVTGNSPSIGASVCILITHPPSDLKGGTRGVWPISMCMFVQFDPERP